MRKQFKHGNGKARSGGYISWCGMRARCYIVTDKDYHNYGGRGIKVCDRWMDENEGYINFLIDMGERPGKEYSIDRIDYNGNYEPSNCRWATKVEQNNNKRDNCFLEYQGEKKTVAQWATSLGIKSGVLRSRIRGGWSIKDILTTPLVTNQHTRKAYINSA